MPSPVCAQVIRVAVARKSKPGDTYPIRGVLGDRILMVCLVALSVGNLILPEEVQTIGGVDYILLSCIAILILLLLRLRLFLHSFDALFFCVLAVTIVPGVTMVSGTPYSQQKVLALALMLIMIAAPSLFWVQNYGRSILVRGLWVVSAACAVVFIPLNQLTPTDRRSLFDMNPIGVSRLVGVGVVIALVLALRGKARRTRRLMFAIVGTSVVGITAMILTGSRGPLVGIVIAVLLVIAVRVEKSRRRISRLVLLVVAVLFAVAWSGSIDDTGLNRVVESNAWGRADLYADTFRVILGNPLGIGWGNLAAYLPNYTVEAGGRLYAHNIFLEFAVEGGVIAVVGLIAVLAVAGRRCWIAARSSAGLGPLSILAVLAYALANAQFSSDLIGDRLLWVILGFAIGSVPPTMRARAIGRANAARRLSGGSAT